MARRVFIAVFLLGAIGVYAAEQPELVDQQPQYSRTTELPALKISFADMKSMLEKVANLLSAPSKSGIPVFVLLFMDGCARFKTSTGLERFFGPPGRQRHSGRSGGGYLFCLRARSFAAFYPPAKQPELVEQKAQKPEYTRTKELPALKISSIDMQSVLETAAKLLSDANRDEGKKTKDIYLTETLELGTGQMKSKS